MKRVLLTVSGCVQGVGFRPFVFRLANQYCLAGSIKNNSSGVKIDIQGSPENIEKFQKDLKAQKPERAIISAIKIEETFLHEKAHFEIECSEKTLETALALLPDTALCKLCLQELLDPNNRRYQYPFLHCVSCGPRFSLFLRMPFDRHNTSMVDFKMCAECSQEYNAPDNRRFFSQTNCCPKCGPDLLLTDSKGSLLATKHQALQIAITYLQEGKIVCMKNTGGFLLLADATNNQTISQLRIKKRRPRKPFALLMPNLDQIKQIVHLTAASQTVLTSAASPIVLLKKRGNDCHISSEVAPDSPYYGIMLPHNALQHLIINELCLPLIATSGNISEQPICINENEALSQLADVADAFLFHNRRIMHRLDDSVVQMIADEPMVLRRARGYIPFAITLPNSINSQEASLIAVGSHQKNSFALRMNDKIYCSQHIGNLESFYSCQAYNQEVENWEKLLNIKPQIGIRDKHPYYYTSQYLQERQMPSEDIQHHRAHIWAGMLDNKLSPPLLGFSWDGTGLGDDETIWGGEAFIFKEKSLHRFSTLHPFKLPGGEKAIKEPRRTALGLLHAMFAGQIPSQISAWLSNSFKDNELILLFKALEKGINSPICSSMGRLFDGVSALLDLCLISHFEGQAALALEALANKSNNYSISYKFALSNEKELWVIDWRPMISQIFEDKVKGIAIENIALGFHNTLANCIVDLAHIAEQKDVLLTGGVMQNKLLAEIAISKLKLEGFKPYWHRDIPPNDGGLAVGQIIGKLYS